MKQPRNDVDEFAAEMQRAMSETYREVSRPKDRLIRTLWATDFGLLLVSVAQAMYIIWTAR